MKLWTSTYLSLESHLPASKCCCGREFVKMKIRNLKSLLVCSIILWKSSLTKDDWISGWRSWLASRIQFVSGFWRSLVTCGDVSSVTLEIQGWNPPGLGDEEDACGFAKNVSRHTNAYPKYLAAYRCGSAFPQDGLASRQDHDKVEVTQVDWQRGNVHCVLIRNLYNLSSHSYN